MGTITKQRGRLACGKLRESKTCTKQVRTWQCLQFQLALVFLHLWRLPLSLGLALPKRGAAKEVLVCLTLPAMAPCKMFTVSKLRHDTYNEALYSDQLRDRCKDTCYVANFQHLDTLQCNVPANPYVRIKRRGGGSTCGFLSCFLLRLS